MPNNGNGKEPQPKIFRIIPNYSPATGIINSFTVEDPEGTTVAKWREYITEISLRNPRIPIDELEEAKVEYFQYRAIFVLPQEEAAQGEEKWWTLAPNNLAVGSKWEPPTTDVARFWEIYHQSEGVEIPDSTLELKDWVFDVLASGRQFKESRAKNMDRYFYALDQVKSVKLPLWFVKTFFVK